MNSYIINITTLAKQIASVGSQIKTMTVMVVVAVAAAAVVVVVEMREVT